MAEYIEREFFYNFLSDQLVVCRGMYTKGLNQGLNIARSALHNKDAIPSADVVEVVRCRDCKRKKHCMIYENHLAQNEFCSLGERKEK